MTVNFDNTYMYKYLDEQHQRDIQKTRAIEIENKRKEIPFILAKYAGIALIIFALGLAIKYANSFVQIVKNEEIVSNQSAGQSYREDQVIDVDALLNESSSDSEVLKSMEESNPPEDYVTIRNYVIFDEIEFVKEDLDRIIIGREYADPDSKSSESWCYVDIDRGNSKKDSLYLKIVSGNEVEIPEITQDVANDFGVSREVLIEAQSLCTN